MRYAKLVETYAQLESTSKRLEKTTIIAHLLKHTKEDLNKITLLLQGRVFPTYNDVPIGIASKLVVKALQVATGLSEKIIMREWKKKGDLGDVAEELASKKTQATLFHAHLTVAKVFENIKKLSTIEGKGSVGMKLKVIAELVSSATPQEAKYITRTLLEDLRVGVGDGTLRDAIVEAFFSVDRENREEYNALIDITQKAFDVTNDFGSVAREAMKGKHALEALKLSVGVPLKVMLFQKANDFKDAFERVGTPAAIEQKYDGFRIQAHKDGTKVNLYTRRLDDVTKQFPEIEAWMKKVHAKSCILDGEVIGVDEKSKNFLPFQAISQRIKRKYDIEKMVKDIPVAVRFFDLMELNGKSYLNSPFVERRKQLKTIIHPIEKFHLAEQKIISTEKEAETFFKESLHVGNEGAMMKNLQAPYKPGSRVGYGVKIKSSMETLDLIVVGADWGEGKRSQWLASFTIACKDHGKLLEIGKVGTGIKEKPSEGLSFGELTKLLKPLITEEKGRHVVVKPKMILEIEYEEIQKSPSYASGFALRFPRVLRLREDKKDVSTLSLVKKLYKEQ